MVSKLWIRYDYLQGIEPNFQPGRYLLSRNCVQPFTGVRFLIDVCVKVIERTENTQ